jgi:uncharacterized phiE125 gp8 family phage protein
MNIRVHTPPVAEPLGLEEVKLHCRLDETDVTEDTLLADLIVTAREFVEARINRALMTQTIEIVLDGWPCDGIELPRPPLQSLTSITYTDYLGTVAVVPATTYYLDDDNSPARVMLDYGQSWPSVALRSSGAIVVQFVAGYGDEPTDVPQSILQAMLLLVGHWYEAREAATDARFAAGQQEVPFAVTALLAPYRVWTF